MKLVSVLPNSIEAERYVLSAMMCSIDGLNVACDNLITDDFFYPEHGVIFKTMYEMYKDNQPVSLETLCIELKEKELIEKAKGYSYLGSIYVYNTAQLELTYYIDIIKNHSLKRKLYWLMEDLKRSATEPDTNPIMLLEKLSQQLYNLSLKSLKSTQFTITEMVQGKYEANGKSAIKAIQDMQEQYRQGVQILKGFPTHYTDLDKKIQGLIPGHLTIIGARPGVGKTTFLLNLLEKMILQNDIPIAIFSLEMTNAELLNKLIGQTSGISIEKLKTGNINSQEFHEIVSAIKKLEDKKAIFDDQAGLTLTQLRSRCTRLKQVYGIKAVFVDYLQLLRLDYRAESMQYAIGEISKGLKNMAKDLDVAVVTLAQLNRDVEKRDSKKPVMSDLRDSGSLEQDADEIALLYRENLNADDVNKTATDVLVINIVKNRHGGVGEVRLHFDLTTGKMSNYLPEEKERIYGNSAYKYYT